jgi:hypothetical protein
MGLINLNVMTGVLLQRIVVFAVNEVLIRRFKRIGQGPDV